MSSPTTAAPTPITVTEIKSVTSYPSSSSPSTAPTPQLPGPNNGSSNGLQSGIYILIAILAAILFSVIGYTAWRCTRDRREANRSREYQVDAPPLEAQPHAPQSQAGVPPLVLSELHGHYAPPAAARMDQSVARELHGHYAPPAAPPAAPSAGDVPSKIPGSPAVYG